MCAKPVIGLDFGNYYCQVCSVPDMDTRTRSGQVLDLLDPTASNPNGIPSAFFYSARRNNGQPCFGYQAARSRPAGNIVRYMKRHLGEALTIEGRNFSYDEIITGMISYCVRLAVKQLHAQTQQTTNLVAFSYPVTYNASQRARLKELVEKATLEDGTPLKVVGTITEPAAAALDYLAEHHDNRETVTVMAYDLGAGTFDLSVVQAHPNGRRGPDGSTYYYTVCRADGIADLGGNEFDGIVYKMITQQLDEPPRGALSDSLLVEAELAKRELTVSPEYIPNLILPSGDMPDVVLTRAAFDKLAAPLVEKTIDKMRKMLSAPEIPRPELILLTGGASQMPIVRRMIEEAFPAYRGRIALHRPGKAIAGGAARFATGESDGDIKLLLQRTGYDIGVRYVTPKADGAKLYISTFIPAESPLPFASKPVLSHPSVDAKSTLFEVYEATCKHPDRYQWERDYRRIMRVVYRFDAPAGTNFSTRLIIDKDNILHIEVTMPDHPELPPVTQQIQYTGLS